MRARHRGRERGLHLGREGAAGQPALGHREAKVALEGEKGLAEQRAKVRQVVALADLRVTG